MPFSRNIVCLALIVGLFSQIGQAADGDDAKKTDESAQAGQIDDQAGKINIAIPENQPVKGIHLPFYDITGQLKMQFDAEIANRTTPDLVEMTKLKIETFGDKGVRDMLVNFPHAIYNVASGVIQSKEEVEVRRTDFVLTGVGMEFDTKKRNGRVFSKIRMEIFNRSDDISPPTPTPNGP